MITFKQAIVLLCLLSTFAIAAVASAGTGFDLRALIREVEDQYTGNSSHAFMRMEVRTEHWQRALEMEAWSRGRDRFLVRILEPAKERDVATLKNDREVWNYLPRVDRTIKIPPSMMGGAWMGSHITNNDLVKQSHIDQDYGFTLLNETDDFWLIEGLPKPEAAVIWGKITYRIGKTDRVPQQIAYFDEDMVKVREIRFEDVQTIDGRRLPLRMIVQPLDKPDEQTVLQYDRLVFDLPLEDDFFSLRNLKRR
jgi:outer membrane lipoprotein-sorting protein